MELAGTLADNLHAAIASAERLRGHRVHADTLNFWRELLSHARAQKRSSDEVAASELDQLIARLQSEVADHEHQS